MNLACSICSEIYEPSDDVTITACGHMFHRACLLTWIERSATCPQCRSPCTVARLTKVYLNTATDQTSNLTTDRTGELRLQQQVDELNIKSREQEDSLKHLEKTVLDKTREHEKMRRRMVVMQDQLRSKDSTVRELRELEKRLEKTVLDKTHANEEMRRNMVGMQKQLQAKDSTVLKLQREIYKMRDDYRRKQNLQQSLARFSLRECCVIEPSKYETTGLYSFGKDFHDCQHDSDSYLDNFCD